MPILPNKKNCTGCLVCIDSCPKNAIEVNYYEDGFTYVEINNNRCIECNICETICPINKDTIYNKSYKPKVYAAFSKNEHIRIKSASGGAFAEIAQNILKKGGIVIGAAIEGKNVKHICIDNINNIELLQGSKYLQSNTNGIYNKTLKLLKDNRIVLFSGLPCHVSALKSFLSKKNYTGQLFTIDLVCHGVPSHKLLNLYEDSCGKEIHRIISFRDKTKGVDFSFTKEFINNKIESKSLKENDFFLRSYGKNLCTRNICYNCPFSKINRNSDLTLGDLWGDNDFKEEHNKGLSLIITHNNIGENLLYSSDLFLKETIWEKVIYKNPRIINGKNFIKYHPIRLNITDIFKNRNLNYQITVFSNEKKINNCKNYILWVLLRILTKGLDYIKIKIFIKNLNR